MVNPFDKAFFHFLFGFIAILSLSFSVLYFTARYDDVLNEKKVTATTENIETSVKNP